MDAERDARIAQAYREHRPYLVDLAFRMLGDIGAAEDAVQDGYGRLVAADIAEIADERGWLIVVTSRLCLDRIKSAHVRREVARDPATIEAAAPVKAWAADPADRVTLDDGVSLALLELLQRLTPAERVVYILHDIFQRPFDTIAQIVGRTTPACRQLAKRARQRLAASDVGARLTVAPAEHRLVTEKFIAACANGDLGGLLEVLTPDARGVRSTRDRPPRDRTSWCRARNVWPGICCTSGVRGPRWSLTRQPGSPGCWGSAVASLSAC